MAGWKTQGSSLINVQIPWLISVMCLVFNSTFTDGERLIPYEQKVGSWTNTNPRQYSNSWHREINVH